MTCGLSSLSKLHSVQFELTEQTKATLAAWLPIRPKELRQLFPGRRKTSQNLSSRQHTRIVRRWFASVALETTPEGGQPPRRRGSAHHTKLESTSDTSV